MSRYIPNRYICTYVYYYSITVLKNNQYADQDAQLFALHPAPSPNT
jgi:hypothetical protein